MGGQTAVNMLRTPVRAQGESGIGPPIAPSDRRNRRPPSQLSHGSSESSGVHETTRFLPVRVCRDRQDKGPVRWRDRPGASRGNPEELPFLGRFSDFVICTRLQQHQRQRPHPSPLGSDHSMLGNRECKRSSPWGTHCQLQDEAS